MMESRNPVLFQAQVQAHSRANRARKDFLKIQATESASDSLKPTPLHPWNAPALLA
jgi:hypothetical protein